MEVVTGSCITRVLRHTIARAKVHQSQIGIRGTDQPHGPAAGFPRVGVFRPRLVSALARSRYHEPFPRLSAALRLERNHLAAETRITGGSDEHEPIRIDR